jgi:electron transfer flavoprotein alpha subunit
MEMSESILLIAHVDDAGGELPKVGYEALNVAVLIASKLQCRLTIGLIGEDVRSAAGILAAAAPRILAVTGAELAHPRYASDAAAIEALCQAAQPSIVIAPATSRFLRAMPGAASRLQGRTDTHITSLELVDGVLTARRWFYRQRLDGTTQRQARPWFLMMDSGCAEPWSTPPGVPQPGKLEMIDVPLPDNLKRTSFSGMRAPARDEQTIRPDAKLLFVAGAGWTKKQSDGKVHVTEAETLILGFLRSSGASLGSSKSLVDQTADKEAVLTFMSHLNQVGQTGSTPRHPKGLSTCCHGEEPHVVGWRFIKERRAVNTDPNCGWARGKADVLYVADAFQVMAKLNSLLKEKKTTEELAVSRQP